MGSGRGLWPSFVPAGSFGGSTCSAGLIAQLDLHNKERSQRNRRQRRERRERKVPASAETNRRFDFSVLGVVGDRGDDGVSFVTLVIFPYCGNRIGQQLRRSKIFIAYGALRPLSERQPEVPFPNFRVYGAPLLHSCRASSEAGR
jgi:hypothetical protein